MSALSEAFALVRADLLRTTGIDLEPQPVGEVSSEYYCLDNSMAVTATDEFPWPSTLETVASQVQDFVLHELVKRGREAIWPPCPVHAAHPLFPQETDDVVVWVCPTDSDMSVPVGELGTENAPAEVASPPGEAQ